MAVKYICVKDCWHGLTRYHRGDFAKFNKAEDGPKDKDGKLLYFEPVEIHDEAEKAVAAARMPKVKVNAKASVK